MIDTNHRKPTLYPELDGYMDREHLYQYRFASRIGMAQPDLSKRLHNKLPWTDEWKQKIADLLEMPIDEAFRQV